MMRIIKVSITAGTVGIEIREYIYIYIQNFSEMM